MAAETVIFICLINSCVGFNLSSLLSSGEKIDILLHEEAKKGKETGYNSAKIKLSNEVIIQLMDKGGKKEHGEEILKLMSEYTVGMNENSLDLVSANDLKTLWKEFEDIFSLGKPPFIEHKCDIKSMRTRFNWDDGPVDYFNYVRKDSLDAWEYFSKQFLLFRKKLKGY